MPRKKILASKAQVEGVLKVAASLGQDPPEIEWLIADSAEQELALAADADAIWTRKDNEFFDGYTIDQWTSDAPSNTWSHTSGVSSL